MDLLLYASFFGSIMLQLFIYCYGGEIIKAEVRLGKQVLFNVCLP